MSNFPELLNALIRERGMTWGAFADRARITTTQASTYRQGKVEPREKVLRRMAKALNMTVEDLIIATGARAGIETSPTRSAPALRSATRLARLMEEDGSLFSVHITIADRDGNVATFSWMASDA